MTEREGTVLAIDPGRRKCGLALVVAGEMEWGAVMRVEEALRKATKVWKEERVDVIALGDGTGAKGVLSGLVREGVPREAIVLIPERGSNLEGRRLYFRRNPPRGLLGWLRRLFLLPPEPFDQYVAWALAMRLKLTERPRRVSKK